MAIETGPVTGTETRRTLEAYFHTPLDGNYTLTLYREVVLKDDAEAVLAQSRDNTPIRRNRAQMEAASVDVGGTIYTGTQVIDILAAFFDLFDGEDQAAIEAARAGRAGVGSMMVGAPVPINATGPAGPIRRVPIVERKSP